MAKNSSLHTAKESKKDEFYTQLSDIENELKHYKQHFKNKTVLCNCDDPYESNFFKYFAMNFNYLGLKKLICTCYAGSPIIYTQMTFEGDNIETQVGTEKKPYVVIITEVKDLNKDGAIDLQDIELLLNSAEGKPKTLKGNGDFRSEECLEYLKSADIVVTNPPFSLFREYIDILMEYKKKFIIIGNQNAITYKEIFPLLKNDKMWLGYGFRGGNAYFAVPHEETERFAEGVYNADTKLVKFRNCAWFTNIDIEKRHEIMVLYKKYDPEDYPHYDNYDAIEVSKLAEIPCDYSGVMGVPITFMDKYNPDQFEILNLSRYLENKQGMKKEFVDTYYAQGNTGQITEGHPDLCYYDNKGKAIVPYMRILIKKKG